MLQNSNTVMPNPKGNLVNVVPTKETVDYNAIYHYTDGDVLKNFRFSKTNRDTYEKNVSKILRQIKDKTYGAAFIPAIIIDINTMYIIDGQNREVAFEKAFKEGVETDMKVIYVDVPSEYIDDLVRVLQEGKKWNNTDYFHRAMANGNSACKRIEEFCETHSELCADKNGINRSYGMAFIYGRRVDKEVKDMTLTVTQKQLDFAEQVYGEVKGLFKSMKYKRAAFLEGMVQSWYNLRKDKTSNFNYFIEDMGMDFIYDNIYSELHAFQPTTKKADWDQKFGQIVYNLYRKFREQQPKAA